MRPRLHTPFIYGNDRLNSPSEHRLPSKHSSDNQETIVVSRGKKVPTENQISPKGYKLGPISGQGSLCFEDCNISPL